MCLNLSVVIPTLNSQQFLVETLESVLSQDITPLEVIAIDGGSTDNTLDILKRYQSFLPIRIIQQSSKGLYQAWNEGISLAFGEWIYVICADDIIYPGVFNYFAKMREANSDVDIYSWPINIIDEQSKVISCGPIPILKELLGNEWINKPHIRTGLLDALTCFCIGSPYLSHMAMIFSKRVWYKTGGFSTTMGSIGDIAWTLSACLQSDVAYYPQIGAAWRLHKNSTTAKIKALQTEAEMYQSMADQKAPEIYNALITQNSTSETAQLFIRKLKRILDMQNQMFAVSRAVQLLIKQQALHIPFHQIRWLFIWLALRLIYLKILDSNNTAYKILITKLKVTSKQSYSFILKPPVTLEQIYFDRSSSLSLHR